ncbi:solute carrier family 2, facilitated glucose transporter member 11-like [Rhinophrynus dorsalis]
MAVAYIKMQGGTQSAPAWSKIKSILAWAEAHILAISTVHIHGTSTCKLFWAAFAVGIGGAFQTGYNISVISPPTTYIQKFINDSYYNRHQTRLDEGLLTLIWSTFASVFTLGGLVGNCIGGGLADRLGRKQTLLINNFFALLAALLMGISEPTGLFELLIVGRIFIGVNAGISMCVQPLYLGEISPKHIRGLVTVSINISLTFGILAGQIAGLREILGRQNTWPFLLATCCIPAFIQLAALPWFPESPRYLLIEKRDEYQCQKALRTMYGATDFKHEMEDIQKESHALNGEKPKTIMEVFTDQKIKWQLIITIVINVGQQFCGINAIYFYAEYVFRRAGIPVQNIPYVTVGTGICECITALTCGLLVDLAGRRVLIIGGYLLMALCCTVLTLTLTFQDAFPWVPYLSMSAIFAFILSFGLGPGGVTNTLATELFTQSTRSGAYTIGGSVNWISLFAVGMVFPFIVNGLGPYCFLVFFATCISIAAFIFFFVPETKNKSFLEINEEFKERNFGRKHKGGGQDNEAFESDT